VKTIGHASFSGRLSRNTVVASSAACAR